MGVYLDYMASTPIHPDVLATMQHYMDAEGIFANPSSTHMMGVAAHRAIDGATERLAACIDADASSIIWTSGATEADNWAILGTVAHYGRQGRHIITIATEHKAVLAPCDYLSEQGVEVTLLGVDHRGRIDLAELAAAIRPDTILVSAMLVNNETGVIHPIAEIVEMAHAKGVLVHVDAVQGAGRVPIHLKEWGVDLASFSAHKVYGPKGVGVLYLADGVHLPPRFFGGQQQHARRPGTLATHQIMGMSAAFEIAVRHLDKHRVHVTQLRDRLWQGLSVLPGVQLNVDFADTIPNVINFRFEQIDMGALMFALREIALSSGSACNAASDAPSHVLLAMGLTPSQARRSMRISVGCYLDEATIDQVIARFTEEVQRLDAMRARAE